MSSSSTSTIALPGQSLGASTQHTPGAGTHIYNNTICASLAGLLTSSTPQLPKTTASKQPTKPTSTPSSLAELAVLRSLPSTNTNTPILPQVNTTVLARITRTTPRQANCSILCTTSNTSSSSPSTEATSWPAIIRLQDIRATELDRVKIADSFRPGDIVRARVISLGDQQSYYLSTAGNEFGVVMATSEAGNACVPVSWKEVRDGVTGVGELRKVARP